MLDTGAVTRPAWHDDVVMPALLRAARAAYGRSVREELAESGFDDLPRNGAFVLGALVNRGGDLAGVTQHLGVSRPAVGQLVDALVSRGYLTRADGAAVTVTERGRSAAARVKAGVEAMDQELASRLEPTELAALRGGLAVLSELADAPADPVADPVADAPLAPVTARPARPTTEVTSMNQFAPIFPVTDLARALRHYQSLGFTVSAYDGADEYGFADRDEVSLHLSLHPDLDPLTGAGAAYLYVRDADALAAEWSRPGIGGRTHQPTDTPYGLREGAHLDLDNNLIRFGSPISQ
jgi:DNA-binding MarR family transcriptional regulator